MIWGVVGVLLVGIGLIGAVILGAYLDLKEGDKVKRTGAVLRVPVGDAMIGRVTSGGFGWRVGKSLALAMVRRDRAAIGSKLEVDILGTRHRARVIAASPFDPENRRLKG